MTGDVDVNFQIDAVDIIRQVGYVFKAKKTPDPWTAAGDVNCDAKVDAADIIVLVIYVFKSGVSICDVCPLVIDGTWECL